ncbi:MAG: NAD(P)H-dependent oxidoreductase [Alphaproteobacteria bacterium]|jgi:modulator of drug activity B
MSNVLIISAHHYYPFAEGKLNKTLAELAEDSLKEKGHDVRIVNTEEDYDVETELENHKWADTVIIQTPMNWMMVTWSFKKYMDDVYTAGMCGALCNGDGRHHDAPKEGYGTGGTMSGKKYMLSITMNAPKEAFDDPKEYLFEGKSVDDLWLPMHANFKFFDMNPLPTFVCYDVMKNAEAEKDFERYKKHLDANF